MARVSVGLVSGIQVITEKGEQNIEYIKPGDKVLTHMGRFKRVKNVCSRIFRGEVLQIDVRCFPTIQCDGAMRFFSIGENNKRQWTQAIDLQPKSDLCQQSINNGEPCGEWVKVRKKQRICSSCRYLYGLEVEEDESFTANGYIVSSMRE